MKKSYSLLYFAFCLLVLPLYFIGCSKETTPSFTVTFNSNGGSMVQSQTVQSGQKATRPADPTKADSSFDNWYSNTALSTVFDFNTAITGNTMLYAKWTIKKYTVTFNSNGGDNVPPQTVDSGQKATKPTIATKSGAILLAGWYRDPSFTTLFNFNTDVVTSDLVLYAKWLTNLDWKQVTPAATFNVRRSHSSFVFNNKMWVLAGLKSYSAPSYNDVWYSTDGSTWTEATKSSTSRFTGRFRQQAFIFNNKMWVIGGMDDNNVFLNDVWSSSDGSTWTQTTTGQSIFSGRIKFSAVVFGGKMWVIGGVDQGGNLLNDVWYSTDGSTWTQTTTTLPRFEGRASFTCLAFNNKIWVIAGEAGSDASGNIIYLKDIWSSTDGANWTQETANATFGNRSNHASTVLDNKMWVIGGITSGGVSPVATDNVWYSTDGKVWSKATATQGNELPLKYDQSAITFGEKIVVIAGGNDASKSLSSSSDDSSNDVWSAPK